MEKQTSEQIPFPKIDILPGVAWLRRIGGLICSSAVNENTGGGPALDKHLEIRDEK